MIQNQIFPQVSDANENVYHPIARQDYQLLQNSINETGQDYSETNKKRPKKKKKGRKKKIKGRKRKKKGRKQKKKIRIKKKSAEWKKKHCPENVRILIPACEI